MAKILVADDNSNIQKMVGLALKDQGIDVVAVGNGEAAVRKISDVRPDLVLADVFMPVRNGYEVCQFVKADSALAHIPVILLVGAFDPLDEQEAQRVGADGVLKKPFVPPDPLISMVKSALARSGVSAAPPPREAPLPGVAEMLAPRTPPSISSMPPIQEFPSMESESLLGTVPTQPEPVKIDSGAQPLAFGSLLETPAEQEQEEDSAYATTARPQLERDWDSPEEEVEEEEEESSASWRRDGGDEAIEQEAETKSGTEDWRETAFGDAPTRKTHREPWTPTKEISGIEEPAETEEEVSAFVKQTEPAESKPVPPPAPVAPFSPDAWSAALQGKPATPAETAPVEPPTSAPSSPEVHTEVSSTAQTGAPPERSKPAADSSWYSAVSSPWDAEVQKASKLASTWDDSGANGSAPPGVQESVPPVTLPQGKEDPAATVDTLPATLSDDVKAKVEEAALPAAAMEEIREESHYVAENAIEEEHAAKNDDAKPSEPNMEDLVAKVLAKMSPEVLQAVTREILKPVVEAMVKDELNATKK